MYDPLALRQQGRTADIRIGINSHFAKPEQEDNFSVFYLREPQRRALLAPESERKGEELCSTIADTRPLRIRIIFALSSWGRLVSISTDDELTNYWIRCNSVYIRWRARVAIYTASMMLDAKLHLPGHMVPGCLCRSPKSNRWHSGTHKFHGVSARLIVCATLFSPRPP